MSDIDHEWPRVSGNRSLELRVKLFGGREEIVKVVVSSRGFAFWQAALAVDDPNNVRSVTLLRDDDHEICAARTFGGVVAEGDDDDPGLRNIVYPPGTQPGAVQTVYEIVIEFHQGVSDVVLVRAKTRAEAYRSAVIESGSGSSIICMSLVGIGKTRCRENEFWSGSLWELEEDRLYGGVREFELDLPMENP